MRRAGRLVLMMSAGALGVGLAVVVGIAVAKTFTLQVDKSAKVTNFLSPDPPKTTIENIVGAAGGFAVYELAGDSKSHPECTKANGCFGFWPPVPAGKKPAKQLGIKGKLGTWHRNGMTQLLLGGHPLYFFSQDRHRKRATGEGIHSFGGVWHVIAVGRSSAGHTGSTTGAGTTTPPYTVPAGPTPTTTTPTTPFPYPHP